MAIQASIVKRSRTAKLGALTNRLAIAIAKQRGDSDFERYTKLRKRYLAMKKKIILKNRSRAIMAARKLISQQVGSTGQNPQSPKK